MKIIWIDAGPGISTAARQAHIPQSVANNSRRYISYQALSSKEGLNLHHNNSFTIVSRFYGILTKPSVTRYDTLSPASGWGERPQSRHLKGRGSKYTIRLRDLPPNSGKTKTNRLKTERKAKLKRRQLSL